MSVRNPQGNDEDGNEPSESPNNGDSVRIDTVIDRLENPDECRFCGAEAVVVAKHKELSESPHKGGNPLRNVCLSCGRGGTMASREEWQKSADRFISPKGTSKYLPLWECVDCGSSIQGYVEECDSCGRKYEW